MLHVGILPNHARVGATSSPTSRSSWSTRRTSTAACSARTSPTCCAGCGGRRRLRHRAALPARLSATIANPVELAERLTGLDDVALSTSDGSPGAAAADRDVEPAADRRGARRARARALGEAAELLAELVREGARTICFIKSRKARRADQPRSSPTTSRAPTPSSPSASRPTAPATRPQQRRELEARLIERRAARASSPPTRSSSASTSARSTRRSCVTFPGTVASLRQMWGRAGRRGRGLAVYVAGEDALDQFFCRHPDEFLERPVEAAILDHENEQIHLAHLLCAAHEGPLTDADAEFLGPALAGATPSCSSRRRAASSAAARFVLRRPEDYPAAARLAALGLARQRSRSSTSPRGELLGTVEAARARSTRPRRRGLPAPRALLRGRASSTSTRAARSSRPSTATGTRSPSARPTPRSSACSTAARRSGVTLSLRRGDGHRAGARLPAQAAARPRGRSTSSRSTCPSTASRPRRSGTSCGDDLLDRASRSSVLLGALHATEHAQIAVLPLIAMCDRWDIGGLSTNFHPQTGGPTIFIYDGHPGGVGITRSGFAQLRARSSRDAHRLIARVPVRARLPVVRAVAQVRQPQRAAVQGRGGRADGTNAAAVRLVQVR